MVEETDRIKVNEACELYKDDPIYQQYQGYCDLPESRP